MDNRSRRLDAGALLPGLVSRLRALPAEGAPRHYIWSLGLFFVALFTKQNTITMVATLAGYDVIVGRRRIVPLVAFVRPYVPFALMTAGYLWLRYLLFGQVAREGSLTARGLEDFRILLGRHIRHVVAGDLNASAVSSGSLLP